MRTLAILIIALGALHFPLPAATPTKATIEQHIDTSVNVYGNYAAVKLPISKGVPLHNPTVVALSPDGVIFGANYTGEIFRLLDTDGDGLEDTSALFADVKKDNLRYPTGMTFKGKDLYVATTQEIRIYRDTNGDGVADQSETFAKGWPYSMHAFDWTFAPRFATDGSLYFILCTDSYAKNRAPDPNGMRGSILRTTNGKDLEVFCNGLRFPYGMAINPSGDIFFSDNKGNENPTEELNYAVKGRFYGNNPMKFSGHPPETRPILDVKYGFGAGGIAFNSQNNDFGGTAGDLFVSCWGPDGAWTKGSITRVRLKKTPDGGYVAEEFRFSDGPSKVIELAFGSNGDLYVARFGIEGQHHEPYKKPEGDIYRFIHAPWVTSAKPLEVAEVARGNPLEGRKHFESLQCATCHSLDPKVEMLGPDLGDVGLRLSRAELLEAIKEPSKNIKTGFEQQIFKTKEQGVQTGIVVASTDTKIELLIAGNKRFTISKDQIISNRMAAESLMPQELLKDTTAVQIDDLLAYLQSLKIVPNSSDGAAVDKPNISKKESSGPRTSTLGFSWREEEGKSLGLTLNGKTIWEMHWPQKQKPFLHPLATADGEPLSWLNPSDHIWHRAVWFSWKYINNVNYWEEHPNGIADGLTEVSAVKVIKNTDHSARFDMDLIYHPPGKENLMTEKRIIIIYPPQADGSYRMDCTHDFTACANLTLDRTPPPGKGGPSHGGYAGFSYRAAKQLSQFQILDSEGRRNMEGHGKNAKWLVFSGILKERNNRVASVAMFDHPSNPRHPSPWYIVMNKEFGYFSPAFIFDQPYEMKSGQKLTLNYRLMVSNGSPDQKKLEEEFSAFAKSLLRP